MRVLAMVDARSDQRSGPEGGDEHALFAEAASNSIR